MAAPQAPSDGVRRLYDLMLRVNSPLELSEVLHEVANGVVEGLGYGIAAISVLEGDTLVMTAVAGPEEVRAAILGRRTPKEAVFEEFSHADEWGILRFVPHDRLDPETTPYAWRPDYEPAQEPDAWHPMDALYAPLLSAGGRVLGNMSVDLPPGGRIPAESERELLEMFVVQAGLAIAHAQQRADLAEQLRLGQTVREVSALGAEHDLGRVLELAARTLQHGLRATQVTVRCFSESGERSDLVAGSPTPAHGGDHVVELLSDLAEHTEDGDGRPLDLRTDGGDWPVLRRTATAVRQVMTDRDWARALIAPLVLGRDVLGYLAVSRTSDEPDFTLEEVATVQTVSRELGRIVQDARVRVRERRLLLELQQLDRYRGELIATISHELKTPLTSIMGHTELLEDSGADLTSVEAIMRNARRLDRLITDLLNFSRVQELPEIVRAPVDLVGLARASIDLLAVQARTGGVGVSMVEEGAVMADADAEELGRVIDNIVGNAVKYTRPGGQVTVAVHRRGDRAEVAVTDTGLGISAADRPHVFSAFHRSSNLDAQTIPGSGLGLAIARRIAELHGGEITLDSELGRGSTFTLALPLQAR